MYCKSLSVSNIFTGLGQDEMQGAVQGAMQGEVQDVMQGVGQDEGESACVVVSVYTSTMHFVPPLPILTLGGSQQSSGAGDANLSEYVYGEWVILLKLREHT